MSPAGVLPLPVQVTKVDRGSWTSGVSLYIIRWAVKRCCLPYSILRVVPDRAALAVWLGGLDLCDFGAGESPGAPSADERMLDWIVSSVKSGWTPREVILWIFPSFGGLLFDLVRDESGST